MPIFWAIAKGMLPIIGVAKTYQVDVAVRSTELELISERIKTMEKLADETPLNVIRDWEKEMK